MQTAFDRRRINGPDESAPPIFDDDDSQWKLGQPRQGRQISETRPIFLKPGLITQANGSAYIETAKIKIACAVYGPRQSKNTSYSEKGRLNVEVKFAPFSSVQRRAPMRDAEDRSIAVAIHQAISSSVRLELLPKSTIDIFITIIEADGLESCIAVGSLAASTALADAGIEMFGLVMSCSAAVVGNEIWLDPVAAESQAASATIILACMPALSTVTSIWQSGSMKPQDAIACVEACQDCCIGIHSIVASALLESAEYG